MCLLKKLWKRLKMSYRSFCKNSLYTRARPLAVLSLVLTSVLFSVFPQEAETTQPGETQIEAVQAWLLFEQGKKKYRDGEYGEAMRLFREARKERGAFPEVEYWIGALFEVEAELALAEQQYKRAYNLRNQFYIPEEQYSVLYTLADLYDKRKEYKQFEDTLLQIVADDRSFSSPQQRRIRNAMMETLKRDGFDKLLILYRLQTGFALNAHGRLGVYYYRTGRYGRAAEHLLFSVVSIFSKCIEELRIIDPDYKFENGDECLQKILRDKKLNRYVTTSELFRYLYYLAGSLYAESEFDVFNNLMALVSEYSTATVWQQRARRQLAGPFLEPLMEN